MGRRDAEVIASSSREDRFDKCGVSSERIALGYSLLATERERAMLCTNIKTQARSKHATQQERESDAVLATEHKHQDTARSKHATKQAAEEMRVAMR